MRGIAVTGGPTWFTTTSFTFCAQLVGKPPTALAPASKPTALPTPRNRRRRDTLLKAMTGDVADHVLAHNYGQTLALSLMEMDARGELEPHARFMAWLEAEGRLDRAVEGLPTPAEIVKVRKIQTGFQVDGITGGLGVKQADKDADKSKQ